MEKLFVKHYHPIPPPYGGVQVFVKRLMLSLYKRGLTSGAFRGDKIVGIPNECAKYLDIFPKHARSFFVLPEILRLFKIFKPYQIIHTHATLTTCLGIWIIHKLQKKPVVYTIHNQMIEKEFSFLFPWDKWCFASLAKSPFVQIITVNENGKSELQKRGYDFYNGIEVIPAYIPPVEVGNPLDYLDKELILFIEEHKRYALYYAESFAIHDEKDVYGTESVIDAFIQAKESEPELALVFCMANVGRKQEQLIKLKNKILSAGIDDSVYWQIGAIHEMWPLLKTATMLLRPTTTDGDSVMIREALAYGLPVIASDVTKRPKGCIIYPENDIKHFVNEILYLSKNPYREIYPQEDKTDKMIEIYNRLLRNIV